MWAFEWPTSKQAGPLWYSTAQRDTADRPASVALGPDGRIFHERRKRHAEHADKDVPQLTEEANPFREGQRAFTAFCRSDPKAKDSNCIVSLSSFNQFTFASVSTGYAESLSLCVFHQAGTISCDGSTEDWSGQLSFQHRWPQRELQHKFRTPCVISSSAFALITTAHLLFFCQVHAKCFASLATLRKTNWSHYRLPNAHLLFVIIKWHVFSLSCN